MLVERLRLVYFPASAVRELSMTAWIENRPRKAGHHPWKDGTERAASPCSASLCEHPSNMKTTVAINALLEPVPV